MRHVGLACFLAVAGTLPLAAQATEPVPPQSARQALIEMFMGKGADDFAKHLPDAARKTLIHKDETPEISIALRVSSLGRDLAAQGGRVETFDTGPNILVSEQPEGHERIEVAVESDSLLGEEEQIDLSVHVYKDGLPQSLPVVPRLIFSLKQQKEVWRLTEVTVAAHVPLTDPDYLKGLRKQQDESNESAAQGRIFMIAQAESAYAANHQEAGYSCTLSNLFPPQAPAEANYSPGLANEESNGYRFGLTGCEGTPVSKYRLMATPLDPESEMKAFCVDESGTLKSVTADKKSSCFSRGEVVNSIVQSAPVAD
jgi:hypothetical protein